MAKKPPTKKPRIIKAAYAEGYRPQSDMKIKGHPSMMDQLEYLEEAYGYQRRTLAERKEVQPEDRQADTGILGGMGLSDSFRCEVEE